LILKKFKGKTQVSYEMLEKMQEEIRECPKNTKRAQTCAKLYANQNSSARSFRVEDMVYLHVKPKISLSTRRCAKLSP